MEYKAIIIGGSAGSFQVVTKIIAALPKNYPLTVFLCLHRLKHIRSGFVEALSIKAQMPIEEPNDKDPVKHGRIYLAPANYHMYVELGNKFALSTEDPVNHSRPSIDLSFESVAYNYNKKAIGIILSGANRDGAMGLKAIKNAGGIAIVQDPKECQVPTMTSASISATKVDYILKTEEIIKFLLNLR
ncbi:MAG: chemotaxis protein CheB [Bacteroidetes bacterium]|nr:chemotaxis protein CheB [Bacteroidota bacterium]